VTTWAGHDHVSFRHLGHACDGVGGVAHRRTCHQLGVDPGACQARHLLADAGDTVVLIDVQRTGTAAGGELGQVHDQHLPALLVHQLRRRGYELRELLGAVQSEHHFGVHRCSTSFSAQRRCRSLNQK